MRDLDETWLGILYHLKDYQISGYISNIEDYETLDILRGALPEFSEHRAAEIEAGATLVDSEIAALKQHIADEDAWGWTGVHGRKLHCEDGEVFVIFLGHSEGQGGIRLEYSCAYETEKQAQTWLETFEIYTCIKG
jgi:hypothetical protein